MSIVLDLGEQPQANAFLSLQQTFEAENKYTLKLCKCDVCDQVQTYERPKPQAMFNENYAYYTSVNQPMVKHFREVSTQLKKRFNTNFVVEIGSNDGAFLQNFKDSEHLGIEPSLNVLNVAMDKGINCWGTFFSENVAREIVSKHGQASIVYAANVMGHVENINDVLAGVSTLLDKHSAVFVFEIYYLPSIVERNEFDLIYDEHIFYYTLHSLQKLLQKHFMHIFDAEKISVHGGSIRCYACSSWCNEREKSSQYTRLLNEEKAKKFDTLEPLWNFSERIVNLRDKARDLLNGLVNDGKTIAGYGATAKSTTVMNYLNLNVSHIKYIVDSTPRKQGTFSPGTHVPIMPESHFRSSPVDYAILFAWNYAEQIMNKNKWFAERGGKWILLHPEPRIV